MFIVPSVADVMRVGGLNNSASGISAINEFESTTTSIINSGFLMLFIGLIISMLITSFLVRTHPIFLFLYILFLAITVFLGFYLGNAYETIVTNPTFSTIIDDASYINVIMRNIAEIVIAVGILSMIIVFSKFSTYGGTQQF